ncbi:hypothetical protein EI94DRAFT_1721366 [Lactarius quietus]|nr:hypothetical protein EI94DRAFT_1721366 [Lactarius quietus]
MTLLFLTILIVVNLGLTLRPIFCLISPPFHHPWSIFNFLLCPRLSITFSSIMSSASSVTVPPPPTSNKLDSVQRIRVMRSSRKLGAVLGATPFLVESSGCSISATLYPASSQHENDHGRAASPMQIKRHRRQGSIFEELPIHSENSLFASYSCDPRSSKESLLTMSTDEGPIPFAAKSRCSAGDAPRPLVLCLNSMPLSPPDSHSLPLSPLSAKTEVPPTPTTPIEPSRAEARRRKMARVVRTLGENVPAELVFQPSETDKAQNTPVETKTTKVLISRSMARPLSTKSQRRRSASVGSSSQWQRLLELPAPVFSSSTRAPEDQRWVGAWNRRNIAQVQRELRALRRR